MVKEYEIELPDRLINMLEVEAKKFGVSPQEVFRNALQRYNDITEQERMQNSKYN